MLTNSYPRMMARYNRWQNASLYRAAGTLDDAERRAARGSFWGSIHRTFVHLCWADQIWLSRFTDIAPPGTTLKESADFLDDWDALKAKRGELDTVLQNWVDGLAEGPIAGTLKWYSGAAGREVEAPIGVIIVHFFNHQTHHRGQLHAMLTAAGAQPDDTDLFLMPADYWEGVESRSG